MDLLVAAAFFAGALLLLGIRVKQVDEWAGTFFTQYMGDIPFFH
jgi:hypothetical protein